MRLEYTSTDRKSRLLRIVSPLLLSFLFCNCRRKRIIVCVVVNRWLIGSQWSDWRKRLQFLSPWNGWIRYKWIFNFVIKWRRIGRWWSDWRVFQFFSLCFCRFWGIIICTEIIPIIVISWRLFDRGGPEASWRSINNRWLDTSRWSIDYGRPDISWRSINYRRPDISWRSINYRRPDTGWRSIDYWWPDSSWRSIDYGWPDSIFFKFLSLQTCWCCNKRIFLFVGWCSILQK